MERAKHSTGVFASRYHMTMSSACVPDITMGEIVLGSSGALVVVDRDESVHESARAHQGDIAERSRAHLLLSCEPFAAKPLSVTDNCVKFCIGNGLEHTCGF